MNLVGLNSLLFHVCPCHGSTQLLGALFRTTRKFSTRIPKKFSTRQQYSDLEFRYSGPTAPDKWGNLCPSYKVCSDGKSQSPINIARKEVVTRPELGSLMVGYKDASATMINQGFNIELEFGNEVGGAFMDGKMYSLNRMHWHSPSEHTIDGVRFAAELHLVHAAADGNKSVVAIIYKYGSPDPFLSQFKDQLDQLVNGSSGSEKTKIPIQHVRTSDIMQTTKEYFRYRGSLTTPPCTENVTWNILTKIREVSEEQVATLKAPLDELCKNNSRPTQPLNGRCVEIPGAS